MNYQIGEATVEGWVYDGKQTSNPPPWAGRIARRENKRVVIQAPSGALVTMEEGSALIRGQGSDPTPVGRVTFEANYKSGGEAPAQHEEQKMPSINEKIEKQLAKQGEAPPDQSATRVENSTGPLDADSGPVMPHADVGTGGGGEAPQPPKAFPLSQGVAGEASSEPDPEEDLVEVDELESAETTAAPAEPQIDHPSTDAKAQRKPSRGKDKGYL